MKAQTERLNLSRSLEFSGFNYLVSRAFRSPGYIIRMQINLEYDSRSQVAPQSFRDAIQAAANVLDATFQDSISINLSVGYGEIEGTPESSGSASAGPSTGIYDSYSQVRSWLVSNASADVQSGVAALPTGSSIQGQSQVVVWRAQEKLMGQISAADTGLDGSAGFATDIPTDLLEGVALHELTHAMGRITDGPQPDIQDLFRFSSLGTRLFSDALPAAASYFSLDGGVTELADFGRNSDDSDFLNSSGLTPNDAFNEFYNASTIQALSSVDLLEMESLGFHTRATTPAKQALFGSITHDASSPGGQVFAIEDGLLGQGANLLDLENWTAAVQNGTSLQTIVHDVLSSPAFTNQFGSYTQISNQAFVEDLYQTALHRAGDPQGEASWENALSSGMSRDDVAYDFVFSTEHENILASTFANGVFVPNATDDTIARLYYATLDRTPDAAGLQSWENAAANGLSLQTIAQDFLSSGEYQSVHGTQTNQQFVDALYQNALGRPADASGEQGWVNAVSQGMSRATVALDFVQSSEAQQHLASNIEIGFKLA